MDTVAELALHRFDQLWRKGQIGDNTYLRSLVIAGVAPHEAAARLTLTRDSGERR